MGGVAAEDGWTREGKMEAHAAQNGEAHVGGAGWRGGLNRQRCQAKGREREASRKEVGSSFLKKSFIPNLKDIERVLELLKA